MTTILKPRPCSIVVKIDNPCHTEGYDDLDYLIRIDIERRISTEHDTDF